MTIVHAVPRAALNQHIAVLGKTGAGKSSVMRSLVEGLLDDKQPVCIVDPKGDWWGLKSSADGKRAGYPIVIFGGEHADVPLNAHAGAHVAELVATGNRPSLIDLGGWTVADRTRFFIDFAAGLFRLARGRRWLVIDEVHNFAPQGKVYDPDAGKMLHWANRLASEGRGKGITLFAASQRPQKVHKDFLTSCETLVAMRVIHPLDRGAVKDWIDGCPDPEKGKEVLGSLASMPRGTGWVWSPEIGFGPQQTAFPLFRTYDSFKPQESGHGERLAGWATVDLDDVRKRLESVIAEAKANDPAELRRQLAEAQRKLAALERAPREMAVDVQALADAERRGRVAGREEAMRHAFDAVQGLLIRLGVDVIDGLKVSALPPIADAPASRARRAPVVVSHHGGTPGPLDVPKFLRSPEDDPGRPPALQLAPGMRRMLIALAQHPGGLTSRKLSLITVIAQGGGTWRTYLGALRGAGYVEGGKDLLKITPAGRLALGSFEPLPHGEALLDHWRAKMGDTGKRRIFDVVVKAYPRALPIDEVGRLTDVEPGGGTWRTYVGELRGLDLIEGSRELRACDDLFR